MHTNNTTTKEIITAPSGMTSSLTLGFAAQDEDPPRI